MGNLVAFFTFSLSIQDVGLISDSAAVTFTAANCTRAVTESMAKRDNKWSRRLKLLLHHIKKSFNKQSRWVCDFESNVE